MSPLIRWRFIVVVIALFVLHRAIADDCTFHDLPIALENSFGDISGLQQCLHSVKFDYSMANQTIWTLIQTFQLYPFKDIAKNSPSYPNTPNFPPISVDIDALLAAIARKVAKGQYSTDWDFQEDITLAVSKLKDVHITYTKPPCYKGIRLQLPYLLSSRMDGSEQVVYIKAVNSDISYYYPSYNQLRDNIGQTVTMINGKPAMQVIEDYGATFGVISRDLGSSFNYALRAFTRRSLQFDYMDSFDSVNFTMSTGNFSFQWFMTSSTSVVSVAMVCPSPPSSNILSSALHPSRLLLSDHEELSNTRQKRQVPPVSGVCIYQLSDSFSTQIYNGVFVIRLTDFETELDWDGIEVQNAFECARDQEIKTVLLDLRSNGGGIVCEGVQLVNKLTNRPDAIYDFRRSPFLDTLKQARDRQSSSVTAGSTLKNTNFGRIGSGTTFGSTDSSWYFDETVPITRGNSTSTYTAKFSYNVCTDNTMDSSFSRVIIVTDGFCGSTCAYVTAYLKEFHKNLVIYTTGGIKKYPLMAYNAFAGGFVVKKSKIASWISAMQVKAPNYGGNFDIQIPMCELYFNATSAVPLEFEFRASDKRIWQWGFERDTDLYDLIISFEPVQSGLSNGAIAGIVIGCLLALILIIIVTCIILRRKCKTTPYQEGFERVPSGGYDPYSTVGQRQPPPPRPTSPYATNTPSSQYPPQNPYWQQTNPQGQRTNSYLTQQPQRPGPSPYASSNPYTSSNPYAPREGASYHYTLQQPQPLPQQLPQSMGGAPTATNQYHH